MSKPKQKGTSKVKPVPVAFKRGLVASYASRIHRTYKTYQPVEVSNFLGERPIFYFLLVMLADKLREYYPKSPLILSIEPVDGEKHLVIQGIATMDSLDDMGILDELDQWWWDEVGKKVCSLLIDLFSFDADGVPVLLEDVKRRRKLGTDFIFGRRSSP